MGMRTQAIAGQLGVNGQLVVNFAGTTQSDLLNPGSMSLNIIGNRRAMNFCVCQAHSGTIMRLDEVWNF